MVIRMLVIPKGVAVVSESFNFDGSEKTSNGTIPLRPTSMEPATEPIHGCQAESIFVRLYLPVNQSDI